MCEGDSSATAMVAERERERSDVEDLESQRNRDGEWVWREGEKKRAG